MIDWLMGIFEDAGRTVLVVLGGIVITYLVFSGIMVAIWIITNG